MKYKKMLFLSLTCFLTAFLMGMSWSREQKEALADRIAPEIIRFHVLANSDSASDQELKLNVKTYLLHIMYEQLGETATKEDIRTYISENSQKLERLADSYISQQGYDYQTHMELTSCYFPTKTYGNMTFPNGTYEAVRVTIGNGEGRNWWCVLYPPLCFVDAAYAYVPDDSKEQLEQVLVDEDFRALIEPEVHVKLKLLDWLN